MIISIVIKLNQYNKTIVILLIYILNFAQISSSKKYYFRKNDVAEKTRVSALQILYSKQKFCKSVNKMILIVNNNSQ